MAIQLSLFGPEATGLTRANDGLEKPGPSVFTSSSSDQQTESEVGTKARQQLQLEKLQELNLRYGMTSVYYVKGQMVGYGDISHCRREDIEHNLGVLAGYLAQSGVNRGGLSKAYDDEVYLLGSIDTSALPEPETWVRLDFNPEKKELYRRTWYKEPLYLLVKTTSGFTPRVVATADEEYEIT